MILQINLEDVLVKINDGTMGPNIANAWSERLENNGNTWLEMSHDGYEQSLGVIHRRRLYINSEGSVIRGQDILEGHGEHKFAVRFHLHRQQFDCFGCPRFQVRFEAIFRPHQECYLLTPFPP